MVVKLDRKIGSLLPSGEKTLMKSSRLVDSAWTVMPSAWTSWGNCARAWETRFWVLTWAMFGSVPTSKVTVRL
jgi:hypothetical protein